MTPARRDLLGTTAGVALASLAGCLGSFPGSGAGSGEGGHPFEARLEGPDDDRRLFDGTDLERVGDVEEGRSATYFLAVALTDDGTAAVSETFRSAGVVSAPEAFEVVLTLDGEELERFGIGPSLAEAIAARDWDGAIRLSFDSREEATDVRDAVCPTLGDTPDCSAG